MRLVSTILLLIFFGYIPFQVFALPEDDKKPLTIESDEALVKLNEGIAEHQGNVKVTQGMRTMHGDTLKIYRAKNGQLSKVILLGELATFNDIIDVNKPPIHAKARRIQYNADEQTLILKDNAELTQGDDKATGPGLMYFVKTGTITSIAKKGEHTTITLKTKMVPHS